MHVLVPLLALAACTDAPLPDDTTPWEPAAVTCPTELPLAPAVDGTDWVASEPPLGGDIIIFGASTADADIVYAGSGQNGIFRSRDQGFTWDFVDVGTGHIYGQFAVSDVNASCFAFTTGQPAVTWDKGDTIYQVDLGDQPPTIQGLVYDEQRLIMISGDGPVYAAERCGAAAPEQIGTIPFVPDPPSSAHSHGQISSVVWAATDGAALYAMDDTGNLYGSNDDGYNWVLQYTDTAWVNVTFRANSAYQWVVRQGTSTYEVQRRVPGGDLSQGFETVATVEGVATGGFLSMDGEYLVSSNLGIWSSERGEIAVGVEDEGRGIFSAARIGEQLLAGYRAGVSVSPDNGASWGWTSEEMTDLDIVNLHVHPTCPNVLFAGTQCRTGTFRSEDYGQSWTRVTADMHYTMGVDIAPTEPGDIWAVTDDELYMSKDMGLTWENRYPKGTGVAGAHYHGLGVSPDRPATVLVGSVGDGEYADDTARVYRTDNHGATWSVSSTGLPESTESFHAIHFSDVIPGAVLLGTYRTGAGISHAGTGPGIGVFRSSDLGNTWAQLDTTDALSYSHFAECEGRVYAATEKGVLVTADFGDSWEVLLAPAEGSEMLNVACAGSRVLAVDPELGIFRSGDAGATWEDWTGSVTFEMDAWETQLGLELSPDGRIAYFTHPGKGIFLRGWE